jgi:hypothetical protein
MVWHDPLYGIAPHTSTISATASNTTSGVASISLVVIVGKMTDCSAIGLPANPLPCRAPGALQYTHQCAYSGAPASETCRYEVSVEDHSLISYRAVATPVAGESAHSVTITYSGGQPVEFLAAPVWWHNAGPESDPSYIDLAILPDSDYNGTYTDFSTHVGRYLANVFLNDTRNYAIKYATHRHMFNLWVAPFDGADADSNCNRDAGALGSITAVMDGFAIFHTKTFRDCANPSPPGSGSVDVTDKPDWLLVHESAHFLFGLADEYGPGGKEPASDPPNTFDSESECDDIAAMLAADPPGCVRFADPPASFAWRIDGNEIETMAERNYQSTFNYASDVAVTNRIKKCLSGACY